MNESLRLKELYDYQILDSPPLQELDDLAYLASVICDKPISMISLVDKDQNWFKATTGTDLTFTNRSGSFCQHTFENQDEVFIIKDAACDERFKRSPLVVNDPGIRFYAGAPLTSPNGLVLGALCVVDNKPGDLTLEKQEVLLLLSKRAIEFLDSRKLILNQKDAIENNGRRLKHLTDAAPGVLFQFSLNREAFNLEFISKGISHLNSTLTPKSLAANPKTFLNFIGKEDHESLKGTLKRAALNQLPFLIEFRVINDNGMNQWYLAKAHPQKDIEGEIVWYGSLQNITHQLEYQKAMEQISFDISHILRSPVTNLLGLSNLIEEERESLNEVKLLEYSSYIQTVSKELDIFTRNLNTIYENKKKILFPGMGVRN